MEESLHGRGGWTTPWEVKRDYHWPKKNWKEGTVFRAEEKSSGGKEKSISFPEREHFTWGGKKPVARGLKKNPKENASMHQKSSRGERKGPTGDPGKQL